MDPDDREWMDNPCKEVKAKNRKLKERIAGLTAERDALAERVRRYEAFVAAVDAMEAFQAQFRVQDETWEEYKDNYYHGGLIKAVEDARAAIDAEQGL